MTSALLSNAEHWLSAFPGAHEPFAVLFGAGASARSGIPPVRPFLAYLFDAMGICPEHLDVLLTSRAPFESTMRKLSELWTLDAVLDIYTLGRPCATHYFIAQALSERRCRYALTTNFDQHFESAYREICNTPLAVNIHAGIGPADSNESDSVPTLTKVHGCISNPSTVALTIDAIFQKVESPRLLAALQVLLVTGQWPTVLVLGYSCSDAFDITPAVEKLASSSTKRVIVLEHATDPNVWRTTQLRNLPTGHPFRGYQGEAVTCDVNALVTAFFAARRMAEPVVAGDSGWRESVARWIHSVRADKGQSGFDVILGHLFQDIAQHKLADFYYERAVRGCPDTPKHLGPVYGSLARSALLQGQLRRAMGLSQQAIEFGERAKDLKSVAVRRVHHAQILDRLGKHAEAEQQLVLSIATFRSLGEQSMLHVALANLGRSRVAREAWHEAEQPLREAIAFARANRQLDREAERLQLLGTALTGQAQYEEARSCYERASVVAAAMGNSVLKATVRGSLGSMYLQQGNFADALRAAEDALVSFTAIGDPLTRAQATNLRGQIKRELGLLREAEVDHREAIQLLHDTGHVTGLSVAYEALAMTLARMGRRQEAEEAERESRSYDKRQSS